MRRFLVLLALLASTAVTGQTPPPKLEPLPAPPPPPPGMRDIDAPERGVRIPTREEEQVEPVYDGGGQVTRLKVTPPGGGTPYYLIDTTGNGTWMRRESLDTGVSAPLWQVFTFD